MVDETITCPYCSQRVGSQTSSCANCNKIFPWSIETDRLQEQMKERETSRVRATVTLVQEALETARGGRPVSLSAIKGFVTAWLFPRAVVVIGSLLGGVVLVAQTYILWNQTRLLDLQTKAAQLEQVVQIRDRLGIISAHMTALARLKTVYNAGINIPPCNSSACGSNVVRTTLRGLREDIPDLPPLEAKVVWLSLSEQLAAISRDANRIVRQPKVSIREDEIPNDLAVVTDLIRPAATYCLLEGNKSAPLVEQANAFALLTENSHWLAQPLDKPDEYIAFYNQFPQIKTNTQMGLIQYEEAVKGVIAAVRTSSTPSKQEEPDDSYTLLSYLQDVRALHGGLLSSLDNLLEACRRL
jgi:hypothetical protein